MGYKVVERMRGEASPWAPWLAALPARVGSPLTASDAQLAELAGTGLHRATQCAAPWQPLRCLCLAILLSAPLLQGACRCRGKLILIN